MGNERCHDPGLVSVIVPQHGRCDLTYEAVSSLLQHHQDASLEVLVVDDGSQRSERERLQQRLGALLKQEASPPRVTLAPLPRRMGVTGAWNFGIELAAGETLVFLNNDTVSCGAWVELLVKPLQEGTACMTGVSWRQERDLPDRLRARWGETPLLAGWCFGMKRQTLNELGRFDARLPLYFSDTDLQYRLLELVGNAAALHMTGEIPLRHWGRRSTTRLPDRSNQWQRDRSRFFRKWS